MKKKRNSIYIILIISIAICFFLFGCSKVSGKVQEKEAEGKLRIVTTIFPPYDFVRQIVGDTASLSMLLKPGQETHSYEPTPQDIIAIQKADLFLYVGGENDEWVEDILDSPEMQEVRTLRLVDCVETLEEEYVEGMQEETGEYSADEHVWTSPVNAVLIVEKIADTLCELAPEYEQIYKERARSYSEELFALNERFTEITDQAKKSGKDTLLFGDRFPFRYFAQQYGLHYYAAFPGCASDTEPSAATMAFLIRTVKEQEIPVILKMELSNENIANAIAEATGTEVRIFYSCHNITEEQFAAGETYVTLMEKNVDTLKEALGAWH